MKFCVFKILCLQIFISTLAVAQSPELDSIPMTDIKSDTVFTIIQNVPAKKCSYWVKDDYNNRKDVGSIDLYSGECEHTEYAMASRSCRVDAESGDIPAGTSKVTSIYELYGRPWGGRIYLLHENGKKFQITCTRASLDTRGVPISANSLSHSIRKYFAFTYAK